jgi:hypothetical protein
MLLGLKRPRRSKQTRLLLSGVIKLFDRSLFSKSSSRSLHVAASRLLYATRIERLAVDHSRLISSPVALLVCCMLLALDDCLCCSHCFNRLVLTRARVSRGSSCGEGLSSLGHNGPDKQDRPFGKWAMGGFEVGARITRQQIAIQALNRRT